MSMQHFSLVTTRSARSRVQVGQCPAYYMRYFRQTVWPKFARARFARSMAVVVVGGGGIAGGACAFEADDEAAQGPSLVSAIPLPDSKSSSSGGPRGLFFEEVETVRAITLDLLLDL